jgi:hypothetical protein
VPYFKTVLTNWCRGKRRVVCQATALADKELKTLPLGWFLGIGAEAPENSHAYKAYNVFYSVQVKI